MKNNTSGIYAIINKINGKQYIGSSKSVYYRWNQSHRPDLRNNTHGNRHLQSAWEKYGEDNFLFEVIEECDQSVLLEREGHWIEHHRTWEREFGYNFTRIIDGKQIFSEETRKKLSESISNAKQNPNYWTTGTNGEIVKLFKEGESKVGIAKKLEITRSAVYSCLEINGLHKNTGRGSEIKLTEKVREQVSDLREQGKSWEEIVEAVPVSQTQLYRAKAIVPDGKYCTDKLKRKTYRTITPEVIEKAQHLRRTTNMTWQQIADECKVSREWLSAGGITKNFKPLSRKVPKNKMTEEKKKTIIELIEEGKSLKEVSSITGVAQSTIRYHGLHKCT